jgi:hypothetical protein
VTPIYQHTPAQGAPPLTATPGIDQLFSEHTKDHSTCGGHSGVLQLRGSLSTKRGSGPVALEDETRPLDDRPAPVRRIPSSTRTSGIFINLTVLTCIVNNVTHQLSFTTCCWLHLYFLHWFPAGGLAACIVPNQRQQASIPYRRSCRG